MKPDTPTDLALPLDECTARSLRIGQLVTVSGRVFTGRSRFHIRAIEENRLPDLDFERVNAFFHVGPVMRQTPDGWQVVSLEPTSSIRFERYGGEVIRRLGLRTVLGKTTMGAATARALQEVGGVYLSKIGICGNLLGGQVRRVVGVHFLEELGKTEATWVLEVERFGPFFVAIDAHGSQYFQDLDQEVGQRLPALRRALGIPEGYQPTHVNA